MQKKRRLGDRRDGRKLRSIDPMTRVAIFIMKDRNDACNYFSDSLDTAVIDKYILKKRKEGLKGFGMLHLFLAAYVRTLTERPGLNRFISGQTLYARNEIIVSLTIKKAMELNAQETVIKAKFQPGDTVEDIYNKINEIVQENKKDGDQSSFDKFARMINYVPRLLLRGFIGFVKFLDYYGLLPSSLTDLSPFHASFFITSMGSLGIPPIYHHLYNFGNVPVFCSFGAKRPQLMLEKDGSTKQHWFIDYKFVLDERICDGHYYASSLKVFREIMRNPQQLDAPPKEIIDDID